MIIRQQIFTCVPTRDGVENKAKKVPAFIEKKQKINMCGGFKTWLHILRHSSQQDMESCPTTTTTLNLAGLCLLQLIGNSRIDPQD